MKAKILNHLFLFTLLISYYETKCQNDSIPKLQFGMRVLSSNLMADLFFEYRVSAKNYIGLAYTPFTSRNGIGEGNSIALFLNNEVLKKKKNILHVNFGLNYQNNQESDLNFNLTTERSEFKPFFGGRIPRFRHQLMFFSVFEYERLVSNHFSWSFGLIGLFTRHLYYEANQTNFSFMAFPSLAIRYKIGSKKKNPIIDKEEN